jgi:DNA-binding SARP family transcriptional activator
MLAELFWEERTPKQSSANLRVALSSIRKNLAEYVTISRDFISLNPEADVYVDVTEFENHLVDEQLEKSLDLYQGEFLEGYHVRDCRGFEEWLTAERERYRQLVIDALHAIVESHLESETFKSGIKFARRLVKLDALDESAHQQLMRLLTLDNQRPAAITQFEKLSKLLQDELGVEPSAETTRLYEYIQAGNTQKIKSRSSRPSETMRRLAIPITTKIMRVNIQDIAALEHSDGRFKISKERVLIGRSPQADVNLTDLDTNHYVSKEHAWLHYQDGNWTLQVSSKSSNPTMVNGEIIPKGAEVQLNYGDKLQFADISVTFCKGA